MELEIKKLIVPTATFICSLTAYKIAIKQNKDKIQYLLFGSFIGSIAGNLFRNKK